MCGRAALELLREAGVDLPVREYSQDPLSLDELRRVVQLLGVRPIAIARRTEPQFAAHGLTDTTPDEEVLRGWPSVVGRPLEKVRIATQTQVDSISISASAARAVS